MRFHSIYNVLKFGVVWLVVGAAVVCGGERTATRTKRTSPSTRPSSVPATNPATGPKAARVGAWQPVYRGVEYTRAEATEPRAVVVYVLRIDLKAAGIGFVVTPSNGERPLDTDSMVTSEFLRKQKCQAAINASPFSPVVNVSGEPQDVIGLSVSLGDCYSPASKAYGALVISRGNEAKIVRPPIDTRDVYNGVGGFNLLLKDGKNVASWDALHPRTAVGVSRDGRYMVWVVIDGRQPGYSEGTTTSETAEWVRLFGAYNALNLDGGGSTTLVLSDAQGKPKVVNRPIHLWMPGLERPSANHLGVYAKPLAP